jgi:hypothetical protein
MSREFLTRTPDDNTGHAEETRSARETTKPVRNHERLAESIQKYFGNSSEQTERQAEDDAAGNLA